MKSILRAFFVLPVGCVLFSSGLSMAQDLADLPRREVPMAPLQGDAPMDAQKLEASITKGVDFLLSTQNKSGSWGGATRTKGLNIYAPLPGAHHAFRFGSSALALKGLVLAQDQRPEVLACIAKAEAWLLKESERIRRPDVSTTYNNWGYIYGIDAVVALAQREAVSPDKMVAYQQTIQAMLDKLFVNQGIDGGWGYYNRIATTRPAGGSTSFTTGAAMLAIHRAKKIFTLKIPEKRMEMAMMALLMQRTADFCYVYSREHIYHPRAPINRPAGSLGRSQVGNAAARVWGDPKVTDAVLTQWLDRLVKRNGWLDIGRKRPRPHEAHFAIAGYFYYFAHYYAIDCIQLLPSEQQPQWQHKYARIIVSKQDEDGSWWDFPLYNYHQAYGTGYALSTLTQCRVK